MLAVGTERDGVLIRSGWPNVSNRSPLATSHSFTVRSPLALASSLPPRIEGQGKHSPVVPLQRSLLGAGVQVPKFDLLIVSGGGEDLHVGTDRDGIQTVAMPAEFANQAAVGDFHSVASPNKPACPAAAASIELSALNARSFTLPG